jgi:hypothetical protein
VGTHRGLTELTLPLSGTQEPRSAVQELVITDRRDHGTTIIDRPSVRWAESLCMLETKLEMVRIVLRWTPIEHDVARRIFEEQHNIGNPTAQRP